MLGTNIYFWVFLMGVSLAMLSEKKVQKLSLGKNLFKRYQYVLFMH